MKKQSRWIIKSNPGKNSRIWIWTVTKYNNWEFYAKNNQKSTNLSINLFFNFFPDKKVQLDHRSECAEIKSYTQIIEKLKEREKAVTCFMTHCYLVQYLGMFEENSTYWTSWEKFPRHFQKINKQNTIAI